LIEANRRPRIADLARAAGVSVATVDRVLTGRLPVREATALRVAEAAQRIDFHSAALLKKRLARPKRKFGFLLQKPDDFYRSLGAAIEEASARAPDVSCEVEFVAGLSPGDLVEQMRRMADRVDALGVVSVDHPVIAEAIAAIRPRGVPIFALISDLSAEALSGFVGRDNRKEGRTAAWLIAHAATEGGEVGIMVGSHRYLCQETCEISFRAYLREHAPNFRVLEPIISLDDSNLAYSGLRSLAAKHKDLVGLYNCGGGMNGLMAAAKEAGLAGRVAIVGHELTDKTRAGLVSGLLTAVIATPCALLAERAIGAMQRALTPGEAANERHSIVPFDLFLPTNV